MADELNNKNNKHNKGSDERRKELLSMFASAMKEHLEDPDDDDKFDKFKDEVRRLASYDEITAVKAVGVYKDLAHKQIRGQQKNILELFNRHFTN